MTRVMRMVAATISCGAMHGPPFGPVIEDRVVTLVVGITLIVATMALSPVPHLPVTRQSHVQCKARTR